MRRTNFYLDPDKLRALKMVAASEDSSVSDLVREAIDGKISQRLAQAKMARSGSTKALATALLDGALRRIDARGVAEDRPDDIERDVAEAVIETRGERAGRRRAAGTSAGNE